MARIKYFEQQKIAIYIYGEQMGKHHGKHILVLKADEDCQYDFNGRPVKSSKKLKRKEDDICVREWILKHRLELEIAWEKINNGERPDIID